MSQNDAHLDDLPPFYLWLQHKRNTLKITQEDLSAALDGRSRNSVADWENGKTLPSIKSQAAMNAFFREDVFAQVRLITKQQEDTRLAEVATASPEQHAAPLPHIVPPFRVRVQKTRGYHLPFVVGGLFLLLLSILGTVLSTPHTLSSPVTTLYGRITFLSSGLIEDNSTNGIADRLQIDVQGIPPPQPHKQYYGYLTSDAPESPGVFLGKLVVHNGAIHTLYYGDDMHTNLLDTAPNFRLTEEDDHGDMQPLGIPDKTLWRYSATLPDMHPDTQQFGLRDHIQHLFAVDPSLYQRELYGGLLVWLSRTMKQNVQWSFQARQLFLTGSSAVAIRDPLVRMLNTLDGANTPHLDLPPQPVLLDGLERRSASIPLLPQGQQPPISESATTFEESSYISHIDLHLRGIHVLAPDTQTQEEAQHLLDDLTYTTALLIQARTLVKQLLRMTETQLLQHMTLFLLDTLESLIDESFAGPQGIYSIVTQAQQLTTMDVTFYR